MQQRTFVDGRYTLLRSLGSGGMAEVFLAHDEILDRDVALKILAEHLARDDEFVERFRREALAAASLSHPNIVPVYDRGESEDGSHYIAMEYVSGGTLGERIVRDGPLPARVAAEVAEQIGAALQNAHERGIVHRDVKPQNVLVTSSGDVKVADFGIAFAANSSSTTVSSTDTVLGTVRYMSPEQATGEPVGPASDLYSMGVVLYEMLTGEAPFNADTPVAISLKHVGEPPRPPREVDPQVPEGLNAVVLKLLAKSPEDRYADAAELVADLRRVLDGLAPLAIQDETRRSTPVAAVAFDGPVMRGGTLRRRRKRLLAPAFLALGALVGVFGWGVLGFSGSGKIVGTLEGVPARTQQTAGKVVGEVRRAASVKVPSVKGLSEDAAKASLAQSGLGAAIRHRQSAREDAGKVIEQSVEPGKEVERGSRILLAIGDGPRFASGQTYPSSSGGGSGSEAGGGGGDSGGIVGSGSGSGGGGSAGYGGSGTSGPGFSYAAGQKGESTTPEATAPSEATSLPETTTPSETTTPTAAVIPSGTTTSKGTTRQATTPETTSSSETTTPQTTTPSQATTPPETTAPPELSRPYPVSQGFESGGTGVVGDQYTR